MKAVWNGSLSFGLVNIPVKLYSAVEASTPGFKMLCRKCLSPVHYKRVCECEEEVGWADVVKGIEVEDGKYVILEKAELEALRPEKSNIMEIVAFIDADMLHPIYFKDHYYIGPATEKQKAYYLLRDVMQEHAKMAVAKFVMRDKEYVSAIAAYGDILLATTLNYAHEIRDPAKVDNLKIKPKTEKPEKELAKKLIDSLYSRRFDIAEYKDNYAEELTAILKKKAKGEPLITIVSEERKETTEKNLIAALKESLK